MSVELEPLELGFRKPFSQEVSQTLHLRNRSVEPVAFKVKTTAPKQYCVRPNSGLIEVGDEVEVQVLLQAMKEDPPPDAKCKDKFLVQSVAVAPDDKDYDNVTALWNRIEHLSKASIHEKKIRVSYLPAAGDISTPSKSVNGLGYANDKSVSSSPFPADTSTPEAMHHAKSEQSPSVMGQEARGGGGDSIIEKGRSSLANAANAVPTSTEDLKSQLSEAQTTIKRLTQQMDQGIRQRTSGLVSQTKGNSRLSMVNAGGQQNGPGGVPVQVVAGLCLLSFLLAYFFF